MIGGISTAALLVLFIGSWIWAWSPKRRKAFDEAALLPLDDGEAVEDRGNVA
ncbi:MULTISPECIES: cbb3-type cytochrome oxidase subunit 3 [Pseudoxanthomonas]|jgi:Cbb3-type cytochrome oxidase, subunit 3|uniref:cbb3-type cytochrome oxidase subunit 3 n=1 Tax=Pseudoxanthomonas TaxID=83618 RepID=UPI0004B722D9|nr:MULTISPECIES: cbb3-type cytochrome c oxidase subunit 3 [Pseudoxanthomonas]